MFAKHHKTDTLANLTHCQVAIGCLGIPWVLGANYFLCKLPLRDLRTQADPATTTIRKPPASGSNQSPEESIAVGAAAVSSLVTGFLSFSSGSASTILIELLGFALVAVAFGVATSGPLIVIGAQPNTVPLESWAAIRCAPAGRLVGMLTLM